MTTLSLSTLLNTGRVGEMPSPDTSLARAFLESPELAQRQVRSPLVRLFGHGKSVTKTRNAAVAAMQRRDASSADDVLKLRQKSKENIDKNDRIISVLGNPFTNLFVMPFAPRVINDAKRSRNTLQMCDLYLNNKTLGQTVTVNWRNEDMPRPVKFSRQRNATNLIYF